MFVQIGLEVTRDEFLRVVNTEDFNVSLFLIKKELMIMF